jgi:outer membrane protein assembly factor BamD
MSLGIVPEAQAMAAVLGHNFPESRWYKDSYALLQKDGVKPQASSGSWIAQQWKKIAPGPAAKPPAPEPTLPPQTIEPQPQTPRVPPQDVPTASTNKSGRPYGLTSAN